MKSRYIIFLCMFLLLLAAQRLFGQAGYGKADRLYRQRQFALAVQAYEQELPRKKPGLAVTERIATAYRLMNHQPAAENWYRQVIAFPESRPQNLWFYAQALHANGKYAEAKTQYQAYARQVPAEAEKVNRLLAGIDQALRWQAQPERVKISLAKALNSGAADFSPVLLGEGILFASDRGRAAGQQDQAIYGWTGRPYISLFYAPKNGEDGLEAPRPFDAIPPGPLHNGPAAASADGNLLVFTRSTQQKVKQAVQGDPTRWTRSTKPELVNRFELYWSQKQNGQWSAPEPFSFNNPAAYSVAHPTLSPNGQLLYFASDMSGGQGQTDIYYAEKQADGSWSQPVNAGPVINTPGRESFPSLAPDGTLYFASDGHTGMGGLDLFSARGARESWNAVQNLKAPINSSRDDFGILFEPGKQAGYFSSNRESADGTDDLYAFRVLQKPVILLVQTQVRTQTNRRNSAVQPLPGVTLRLQSRSGKDTVVALTNPAGKSVFELNRSLDYNLRGTKTGYLTRSVNVDPGRTAPGDTLRLNLLFNQNQQEKAIVLDNIYYDLDKWHIRPDAARELDELAQILKDNPRIRIELSAHTDSRESQGYNLRLSQRRAQAAVDYLVAKGISAKRLTARGYGKTRLLNHCRDGVSCPEEAHQLNRRTEFKILK